MSVCQRTKPKPGDQRSTRGGAVVATRKHIVTGPYIAPCPNSCRDQLVQPAASKIGGGGRCWESISIKSSGDACVELVEFREVTCIVARSGVTARLVTHSA